MCSTAPPATQYKSEVWDVITCEYSPTIGGVADYTHRISCALSEILDRVTVWAPGREPDDSPQPGLTIKRCFGRFHINDLVRVNRDWKLQRRPRKVLLQWVAARYNYKSTNILICLWIAWRALRGDEISIMFHETFFDFAEPLIRRKLAALVQRVMAFILVNSSARIFASSSHGAKSLHRFALHSGRITTLPVPANIEPRLDDADAANLRERISSCGEILLGHFGLYNPKIEQLIIPCLTHLLSHKNNIKVVFFGGGAERYRAKLTANNEAISHRVYATTLNRQCEISMHISCCDAMFQPYPEGVTTRRTTAMAALAHGKRLISTTGWMTEDVWHEAPGVSLLETLDAKEMAHQLEMLLSGWTRRLGDEADEAEFYKRHFSLEHTITKLLTFNRCHATE